MNLKKIARFSALLGVATVVLNASALSVRAATESEITRATLKNGLRVVIVRNSLAPVVTTQINYLVGSNEAPPAFPAWPTHWSI